MKMTKPSPADIDAAGDLMAVLSDIGSGYYPKAGEDGPTFFDEDDTDHLRHLHQLIVESLNKAPGWPGRVIGGMCFVVMYDKNQIIDQDDDCLALHPRFAKVEAEREQLRTLLAKARNQLQTTLNSLVETETNPTTGLVNHPDALLAIESEQDLINQISEALGEDAC